MSYEEHEADRRTCPCGRGHIIVHSSSNEWNQMRSSAYLACPICCENYHLERVFSYHSGLSSGRYVLVPNGETLSSELPSINIYATPVPEQLCYRYTYKQLENISAILSATTNCSTIKERDVRKVVSICRDSTGSAKISVVRGLVAKALKLYYQLPTNYESDQKRIAEAKAHIVEI